MAPLADRHAQDALLQVRQLPQVEQPLEEIGRAEMDDRKPRPVEDFLGDEGIAARVARGVAIRRALRQVDDGLGACFLRGLREVHGRMNEAGLDGPDEVGRIDAFHGGADGVDLEEITEHDLGTQLPKSFRAGVLAVHHGANVQAEGDRLFYGGAPSISGCTSNQDLLSHDICPSMNGVFELLGAPS